MLRRALASRSMFQRVKPPRAGRPAWKCAEDYKRHLRHCACARCGHPPRNLSNPIVVAHVDHAGGKGISTKVADRFAIPLCDLCHTEQHTVGWRTFEKELRFADAVALANEFWSEWPGRRQWEADLAAQGGAR